MMRSKMKMNLSMCHPQTKRSQILNMCVNFVNASIRNSRMKIIEIYTSTMPALCSWSAMNVSKQLKSTGIQPISSLSVRTVSTIKDVRGVRRPSTNATIKYILRRSNAYLRNHQQQLTDAHYAILTSSQANKDGFNIYQRKAVTTTLENDNFITTQYMHNIKITRKKNNHTAINSKQELNPGPGTYNIGLPLIRPTYQAIKKND